MSEKKVVARRIVIAFGTICLVLLVVIVGAIANYTMIVNDKDNNIRILKNEKSQFQTWLDGNITHISGSLVKNFSYVVFKDGDTYCAKNGTTGAIDYSGTNASAIINSIVGSYRSIAIRTLKTIYDKFLITNTIIIPDGTRYLTIEGDGCEEHLYLADDANCDMFRVGANCHQIKFANLGIHGNKDHHAGQVHGINFAGASCSDCHVNGCSIVNWTGHCICILGSLSASYIQNCYLENSNGAAIHASGLTNSIISHNYLWHCKYGVYIEPSTFSQDNTIVNNVMSGNDKAGIYVHNSRGNSIVGNWLDANGAGIVINYTFRGLINNNNVRTSSTHGIQSYQCQYLEICNNVVVGSSYSANNKHHGIYVGAGTSYCLISGNIVSSVDYIDRVCYGIYEEVGCWRNIYDDNHVTGAESADIKVSNACGSHVASCYNGTSWISSY